MADMVEIENLSKSYGMQSVLRGITLHIAQGQMVSLTGRSGSGKSTLLHVIGGIDREYQGIVRCCGKELSKLSDIELSHFRNEEIGFVFQSFYLLDHLNCCENVMLPNAFTKHPLSLTKARAQAEEMLNRVGLLNVTEVRPSELSGGEKQRVAIARALFHRPKLLLCDEPTGNLDSVTAMQVIDLFETLNQEGLTLLLVTHDTRIPNRTDRVIEMCDGRLVE